MNTTITSITTSENNRRLTGAALALAATAALLVVWSSEPAASAPVAEDLGSAGDVTYRRSSTFLSGTLSGTPSAGTLGVGCPAGSGALSAGATISDTTDEQALSTIAADPDGAIAEGWTRDSASASLSGYVTCLTAGKTVTADKPPVLVPASSQASQQVMCAGGYVVGGGGRLGPRTAFELSSSYPVDSAADADLVPDNGWRASVDHIGTGQLADPFSVDAYCLAGPKPAYKSATYTVAPFAALSGKASCPTDRAVVGGGVFVSGEAYRSHVVATRPWDSADAGAVPEDGWFSRVRNTTDEDLSVTVHAICR